MDSITIPVMPPIQPHSNSLIELFTELCERLAREDLCNWGYNLGKNFPFSNFKLKYFSEKKKKYSSNSGSSIVSIRDKKLENIFKKYQENVLRVRAVWTGSSVVSIRDKKNWKIKKNIFRARAVWTGFFIVSIRENI